MTWTAQATVAAIVEADGRFLMVEERDDTGSLVFNQPAGHLEAGENLLTAVIRETLEESAWVFQPRGLVGVYQWRVPPDGKTYLRFCFHGECREHRPELTLDPDILRTAWMSYEELAARQQHLRSPLVLRCLEDYIRGISYSLDLIRDLNDE